MWYFYQHFWQTEALDVTKEEALESARLPPRIPPKPTARSALENFHCSSEHDVIRQTSPNFMPDNNLKHAIIAYKPIAQRPGTSSQSRVRSRPTAVPNSLYSSPRLQPPDPADRLLVLQPALVPTRRAPTMARSDSPPSARGARLPARYPPGPLARRRQACSPAGPAHRTAAPHPAPSRRRAKPSPPMVVRTTGVRPVRRLLPTRIKPPITNKRPAPRDRP